MKVCRFVPPRAAQTLYGALIDSEIHVFADQNIFSSDLNRFENRHRLAEVRILPFCEPSKIVCVGRNYAAHAAELGNDVPLEPLLFLKAPSALCGDGAPIVLPAQSQQVEHEGELAVVVKRTARRLAASENPLDYVFGYACLNDVTARDLQRADVQFARAKSFDSFCPISDFIETEFDSTAADVIVRVNGAVRQSGNTAHMVFSVANLIRYISFQMTLQPNDIIATGTPAGVSRLTAGDVCEVEIPGVGVLRNSVVADAANAAWRD